MSTARTVSLREVDVEGDDGEPEGGRVLELAPVDVEGDDVAGVPHPSPRRAAVVDPVLDLRDSSAGAGYSPPTAGELDLRAAVARAHAVVAVDAEHEHRVEGARRSSAWRSRT